MAFETAMADFAWKLFQASSQEGENHFMSPLSISVAMGMVLAGADGTTAEEIHNNMLKGVKPEKAHEKFSEIMESLNTLEKSPYKLHTANRLISHDEIQLLAEFSKILSESYKTEPASVDFTDDRKRENMRMEINTWVEKVTNEKIKDLISSSALDASTRLILVNAIYFKGSWANKFKTRLTIKGPFYTSDSQSVQIDMMMTKEDFLYYETSEMKVLGMPYESGEEFLTMFVFLPNQRNGLEKVMRDLSGKDILHSLTNHVRNMEVRVEIPKFKLEKTLELKTTLPKIGLGEMFSKEANLAKIAGPEQNLRVSSVIHKAFVEVNEEGTEAAAATALQFSPRSLSICHHKIVEFVADHPFLFCIHSRTTNQILFLGKFVNPS